MAEVESLESFERLRPVGLLEKFSTARHSLGCYNNVGLTSRYIISPPVYSLRTLIYLGLAKVITQHPVLSAICLDEDKTSPYFARLLEIDLSTCVTFLSRHKDASLNEGLDEELDQCLQKFLNYSFGDHLGIRTFWRVVVLYDKANPSAFCLSFIFHHALGDGLSGLALHHSFHSAISSILKENRNATTSAPDTAAIVKSPRTPLLPSVEALHDLPVSWSYLLKAIFNGFLPNQLSGVWTGGPVSPPLDRDNFRFRSYALSAHTTSDLLAAARRNSTTLSATLETLLAASIFANLSSEQYITLRSIGPMSIRRFLPPKTINQDSFGLYISAYTEEHHRLLTSGTPTTARELFSWDEARRIRKTIEAELNKAGKDVDIGLLPYINDFHDFFNKKVGKPRDKSFEVSNLGVFNVKDGTTGGNVSVGRMVFSQSGSHTSAALAASTVTGADGCLTFGFTWEEGVVDGVWVAAVVETLKALIEEVANDDR